MPFDTPLHPQEEVAFQQWFANNKKLGNIHPQDMGQDYDMRGAFKAGLQPGPDKHWPDTFKKPNHPTFSDESIYSSLAGTKPGSWKGEQYIPFGYGEQVPLWKRAVDSVANGLRSQAPRAPWGLNHEPTITASQAIRPAMGKVGQVMSDPRNAWIGMGPMAGMALARKGMQRMVPHGPNSGGFNVPTSKMLYDD